MLAVPTTRKNDALSRALPDELKQGDGPDEALKWLDDLEAELNLLSAGSGKSSDKSGGYGEASSGAVMAVLGGSFEEPTTVDVDAEISRIAVEFDHGGYLDRA